LLIFIFYKILLFSHFIKDFDKYYKISFCVIDGMIPSIKDTFTILYSMVEIFFILYFVRQKRAVRHILMHAYRSLLAKVIQKKRS